MGSLFLEHGLHLAAFAPVNAFGRPVALPMLQKSVLLLQGLEAAPLQGCGLGVTDGILNRALSIGVSDPCRVGHHLVVG